MTTSTAGDPATISPELLPCLVAAIAAPSIHNTQPWRFRVRHNVVDVFADQTRRLSVIDPDGRALALSVGAAVFNLRAAMLAHGHLPVLSLLPDPGEPDLLARVVAGATVAPPYAARRLAGAIPHRHSCRRPFTSSSIPDTVADDLRAAAVAEGTRLLIADDALGEGILSVVRTAENRRREDPDYLVELAAWTGPERGRRDGVPAVAYPQRDPEERIPLRDFGLAHPVRHGWPAPGADQPTVAILYSDGDNLRAWVHAGQALERVLLTATAEGLQSTLMTQPLEYRELRALFEDSANGRTAQAIIRLGYGREAPASPRRPLADVLF